MIKQNFSVSSGGVCAATRRNDTSCVKIRQSLFKLQVETATHNAADRIRIRPMMLMLH
jgi:hypothetical protein